LILKKEKWSYLSNSMITNTIDHRLVHTSQSARDCNRVQSSL
jgi:hypothetical protein